VGDEYERALELSRAEFRRLEDEGLIEAAPYALCLGYRIRYVLDLNAREAMHLIELRSGREGHPTYRAVAQAMYERIAAVHPAVTFVSSGIANHFSRQGVEFARSYNAPAPEVMVPAAGLAIVIGGVMIALGIWADLGALLIVAFLIGITPIMHAYWKEQDSQTRITQQVNFMKNVAMLGGALVLFYAYNQLQGAAELSITDPLFSRG
jgi:uncharacterized membrane protein YphA (DoxX/SURF4 family)